MIGRNRKKEFARGSRSAKEYFSKFRSFTKDSSGRIIGNKKSGSTEVIGKIDKGGNDPFYNRWAEAERKIIKSKPVKKIKRRTSSPFGIKIKLPRFWVVNSFKKTFDDNS